MLDVGLWAAIPCSSSRGSPVAPVVVNSPLTLVMLGTSDSPHALCRLLRLRGGTVRCVNARRLTWRRRPISSAAGK